MCNLSQGIKEKGIAIGLAEGCTEGFTEGRTEGFAEGCEENARQIVLTMHSNGLSADLIAKYTGKDIETVRAIIEGKGTH